MMERWFVQKFQEQGRYIVGKWWDRRGGNEIDMIVVDPISLACSSGGKYVSFS